ncbi:hypothetical protein [Streptacidiphilus sp. MAP5-3]|uniref:hypothetical protein n=1 Tax=unclassified Streptacidiphilus TaxID=2643834 RepID=UPI0035142BE9
MPETPGAMFQGIQNWAACVFAPRARVVAAAPVHGADARSVGAAALPEVADFAARADDEELDGFLVEFLDPACGNTLDALITTVRELLTGLITADGHDPAHALAQADSEHWWLTLCGTRWFVLAFAPCYPAVSPRFTFGSTSTYVLLQPVSSFDRRATPRGTTVSPEVRARIRRAYAAGGCPYDHELAQQDVEALKFVWPLRLGDAPVRWWTGATNPGGEPA